ncbi:MAG: thioesterase family protein [Woeseiaceae bacterium]|nr:thioesterase family protein [Woeseiaceae bacterium]
MTGVLPEREGIDVFSGTVAKEWIDVNNHMNVAYYVLAFDLGVDALWRTFGITDDYIRTSNGSTFAVESHIIYLRELKVNEPFIITSQVIGFDDKRVHQFQRMYHEAEGYLAATAEWMNLHVDLGSRRVTPWPDAIRNRIGEFQKSHAHVAEPLELGHTMRVKNSY